MARYCCKRQPQVQQLRTSGGQNRSAQNDQVLSSNVSKFNGKSDTLQLYGEKVGQQWSRLVWIFSLKIRNFQRKNMSRWWAPVRQECKNYDMFFRRFVPTGAPEPFFNHRRLGVKNQVLSHNMTRCFSLHPQFKSCWLLTQYKGKWCKWKMHLLRHNTKRHCAISDLSSKF